MDIMHLSFECLKLTFAKIWFFIWEDTSYQYHGLINLKVRKKKYEHGQAEKLAD